MTSFRKPRYEHKTTLSTYIWSVRDSGEDPKIEWSIMKKSNPYIGGASTCILCALEKITILEGDRKKMLNERSEILNRCRHRSKFLLKNFENG